MPDKTYKSLKPAATGGDVSSKASLSKIVSSVWSQIKGDFRKEFDAFKTYLRNELKQEDRSKKRSFLSPLLRLGKTCKHLRRSCARVYY